MKDIVVDRRDVNIRALDGELRAALGETVAGISVGRQGVIVHLEDDATAEDVTTATRIVVQHDPAVLTADQQAEADEQAALDAARSENTTALDVDSYNSTAAEIQALARKVAWMEREINALQRH
jgi:hypothetical protein